MVAALPTCFLGPTKRRRGPYHVGNGIELEVEKRKCGPNHVTESHFARLTDPIYGEIRCVDLEVHLPALQEVSNSQKTLQRNVLTNALLMTDREVRVRRRGDLPGTARRVLCPSDISQNRS